MKRKTIIWGITLNVLFWCVALLLPVFTGIFSLIIVLLFFAFWLIHTLNHLRNKRYFKLQILFSPLIVLLFFGFGLGLVTFITGDGEFFYNHTSYYEKTDNFYNNLDPTYRIYYLDHRGNYYGPILYYSWGTMYYYYFNDLTLISLVKIFGLPKYNYSGAFPTFAELKKINSVKLDTLPVIESAFDDNIHKRKTKFDDYVHGKILIRDKIVTVKKQHKHQDPWLIPRSVIAQVDSLMANGDTNFQLNMVTYAYTKYYPLIIIPNPYMSRAPFDFGGMLFMYDCLHEKYVAQMLIPDSNYYNTYVKE